MRFLLQEGDTKKRKVWFFRLWRNIYRANLVGVRRGSKDRDTGK